MPEAHIDLPRAKSAGMAGGFFAMFPPPLKSNLAAVVAARGPERKLPPELALADAQAVTIGMASILLRLERAGAPAVCRDGRRVRGGHGAGTLAAIFHIEGAEAIDTDFRVTRRALCGRIALDRASSGAAPMPSAPACRSVTMSIPISGRA